MARGEKGLLAETEGEALDEWAPVAAALRKCIALGGQADSSELRDWAMRELRGYDNEKDLPDYRIVAAPLRFDGSTPGGLITGQPIAPSHLPDFVQEHVREKSKFMNGVAELEELAKSAEKAGEPVKLQLQMGGDVARLMNAERPIQVR